MGVCHLISTTRDLSIKKLLSFLVLCYTGIGLCSHNTLFCCKILFIYLRDTDQDSDRDSEREHELEGEGQADCLLSRDPDVGLDPRTQRL